MELQPNDSVAGWVITEQLSAGAMGVAYLAQHPRLPLATATAATTTTLTLTIAGALEAAHELGIVHRDVKPENVLIMRASLDDPFSVLADFGIAYSRSATALTSDGSVLATPGYAAPE